VSVVLHGWLPSRRWRPVLWALVIVAAGAVAAQLQAGKSISGGIVNALDATGVSFPNPVGILPGTCRSGWARRDVRR
jgi:hypothetical protein